MNIIGSRSRFAAVAVDKSPRRSVLVRPCGMHHNYYFHESQGASTAVLVGECGQPGGLVHNLRHNNSERPVQSSERATQPLDPDGHGTPLPLEAVPLPLIDRLGQVERVAIPEVEPSPPHPDSVEPRTKTVSDVLRHAARIIEERGWVQEDYIQSGGVCAVGGLWLSVGFDGRNDSILTGSVRALLAEAFAACSRIVPAYSIVEFNDEPGRTAAEVIAALRAAADEADR